jgi:hypothetical protein
MWSFESKTNLYKAGVVLYSLVSTTSNLGIPVGRLEEQVGYVYDETMTKHNDGFTSVRGFCTCTSCSTILRTLSHIVT